MSGEEIHNIAAQMDEMQEQFDFPDNGIGPLPPLMERYRER